MNITDFASVIDNDLQFNSKPITSKIKNGRVIDLRIHLLNNKPMIDKTIQQNVIKAYNDYKSKWGNVFRQLYPLLNREFGTHVISKYYALTKGLSRSAYNLRDLCYMIEIKIVGENQTSIGDKLANRYANKGVVSLILPDELRPYALHSKQPVDYITGPLSVISRMNFGQILEGLVAKAITKAESEILKNPDKIPDMLTEISKIANILGDKDYGHLIQSLAFETRYNSVKKNELLSSIKEIGLYFEAPNFTSFNTHDLINQIKTSFNVLPNEPILLRKDLLQLMKKKLKLDIPIPNHNIIVQDIFTAPIYTLKLKQEASARISSRDFGDYKSTTKQPAQGRNRNGVIAQSSRLGHMELTYKLLHVVIHVE